MNLSKSSKEGLAASIVIQGNLIGGVVGPPVLVPEGDVIRSSNNSTSQDSWARAVVMLSDTASIRGARSVAMVRAERRVVTKANHEAGKSVKYLKCK